MEQNQQQLQRPQVEYPELLIRKLDKGYFVSFIGQESDPIQKGVSTFDEVRDIVKHFEENVK